MPGMKQLKKFSDDVTQLGNELIRRQEKGETLPRVNFPAGISDADDSDDFLFGLPVSGQQGGAGASGAGGSSAAAPSEDSPVQSVEDILAGASGSGDSGSDGGEEEFDIEALLAEARGENKNAGAGQSAAADTSLPGLDSIAGGAGASAGSSGAAAKTVPEFSADNPFTLPGMNVEGGGDAPDIDALLSGFSDDVDTPDINVNEMTGSEPVTDDILNNLASADFGSDGNFSEADFTADSDFAVDGGDADFTVQSASDENDPANLFAGLDIPEFNGDAGAGSAGSDGAGAAGGSGAKLSGSGDIGGADIGASSADGLGGTDGTGAADTGSSGASDIGAVGASGAGSDSSDLFGAAGASAGSGEGSDSGAGDFDFSMPDFDAPSDSSANGLGGTDGTGTTGTGTSGADSSGLGDFDIPTDFGTDAGSSGDFDIGSGASGDFDLGAMNFGSGTDSGAGSNAGADFGDIGDIGGAGIGAGSDFETGAGAGGAAASASGTPAGSSAGGLGDADGAGSSGDFDFDLPDFDMPSPDASENAPGSDTDFGAAPESASSIDDDELFSTPTPSSDASSGGLSLPIDSDPESGGFEMPPVDDPFSMPEGNGFNPADSGFNPEEAASFEMPEAPDFGDMSEFSMDAPDGGNMEGSFESIDNDNDFSIPGFSGDSDFDLIPPEVPEQKVQKTVKAEPKKGRKRKEKVVREKNELTEEEYKTFKENLKGYPLNLRIALQEIIVNPDFTDEAIMKILDMVLNRTPARTLANYLEKESLVDYAIPVPANFEKRTVSEYEEYKKSLEYRLKNRIIPIAIVSVISVAFIWLFSFLIATFVVKPVKAEMLYKEGYTLIDNGLYPQSEVKFNEALEYWKKKNWYYKFARSYSDHKQYERAGSMYERLLRTYNYEKKAGIEYARMELDELADYSKAEEITRRFVLDNHINDADGMLLLGDIFLEWATNSTDEEVKEARFQDARMAYADLMSLYGQNDLYLSRMMRYFIRTDQIREVLPLKSYFYPRVEKGVLEGQDLVELSGYLLDKLFGELKPTDEFLRSSIEDVRDLLEQAVINAPEIPESTYNLGRYFVETRNNEAAIAVLEESLGVFDAAEKKTHPRILRNINAYRLIGELKAEDLRYLESERMYDDGINMFEREHERSGLKSNKNVGVLYSDLADIEYFISGDNESALRNYQHSVDNGNDTPSIRYKMGVINYENNNTEEALNSFIKTITELPSERNTLFALGNTLWKRESTLAAQGYYEKLIDLLDREREMTGALYQPLREEQSELVELYMETANNLGVTLYKLAERNSNSTYNARSMSLLSESIRAWDLLTRNKDTMIRSDSKSLASQNLKYMTVPNMKYDPEIYVKLPRFIYGDKILKLPENDSKTE